MGSVGAVVEIKLANTGPSACLGSRWIPQRSYRDL